MARVWGTLLLLALVAGSNVVQAVTPVQKVLQLMNGMVEKGKEEKHAEKVQFATFKTFCEQTIKQKAAAVAEANEMIDALKADIQKYEANAAKASDNVLKYDGDVSTWEGEMKAAIQVREVEAKDFEATFKDYTESIQAVKDGIATLNKEKGATPPAAALIQVRAKLSKGREIIDSFLERDMEGYGDGAPEAAAYEFQSQGIIDMLKDMLQKFKDEQSTMEKQEMNAKNAFELLVSDLKANIAEGQDMSAEATEAKAKGSQDTAEATGQLQDTVATRDDDAKYASDLQATCESKAAAFEERQQLRAEEIAAIEKAIEIMSSGAVAGSAEKHLPGLLQTTALAQLRAGAQSPAMLKVAAYLKGRAERLNSKILSVLAVRVFDDPMKKVKKMIKDLIVKMMEEANEEAAHKGWCDTELSTNEQTRKEKTDGVESLTAEIDELQATISKLSDEVTELSKAVTDLDAAIGKATALRAAEKGKNTATIEDAKAAQEAVAAALGVLKDFYEKAGDATSLLQQEPEVFSDEPYKGMGGASGGVVGMIEVIQSDFARLETDTVAAEESAQKEYDEFMGDSEIDKAQKTADVDHKTSTKQNKEQALQEAKTDLDGTQKELTSAMDVYEKLKPSCVDAGESFEDRVARRKAEIESLQEALAILSS